MRVGAAYRHAGGRRQQLKPSDMPRVDAEYDGSRLTILPLCALHPGGTGLEARASDDKTPPALLDREVVEMAVKYDPRPLEAGTGTIAVSACLLCEPHREVAFALRVVPVEGRDGDAFHADPDTGLEGILGHDMHAGGPFGSGQFERQPDDATDKDAEVATTDRLASPPFLPMVAPYAHEGKGGNERGERDDGLQQKAGAHLELFGQAQVVRRQLALAGMVRVVLAYVAKLEDEDLGGLLGGDLLPSLLDYRADALDEFSGSATSLPCLAGLEIGETQAVRPTGRLRRAHRPPTPAWRSQADGRRLAVRGWPRGP